MTQSDEFLFRIPGWEEQFFSIMEMLADYDRLLAEAYMETDRRIREGFIEVLQFEHHGKHRHPVGRSLGSMEVTTVALKFGIDLHRKD